MKKGTLVSLVIALIAVSGALLGLVAYLRSRQLSGRKDQDTDYMPDDDGMYDDDDYFVGEYVDSHTSQQANLGTAHASSEEPEAVDTPVASTPNQIEEMDLD